MKIHCYINVLNRSTCIKYYIYFYTQVVDNTVGEINIATTKKRKKNNATIKDITPSL